jgi:hypothetical protein
MNSLHYIALAVGIFGVEIVLTYLAWDKVRMYRLCADFCRIQLELRERARELGSEKDPEYLQFVRLSNMLIDRPDFTNWSWIAAGYFNDLPDVSLPRTTVPELRRAIDHAIDHARQSNSCRVVGHLLYETVTGLFIRFCLPSILRARAEKKVERPVKRYLEKLRTVGAGV